MPYLVLFFLSFSLSCVWNAASRAKIWPTVWLLALITRFTKCQLLMWKHWNPRWWVSLKSVVQESSSFMCKIMKRMIQNHMKGWTSQKLQQKKWFRNYLIFIMFFQFPMMLSFLVFWKPQGTNISWLYHNSIIIIINTNTFFILNSWHWTVL